MEDKKKDNVNRLLVHLSEN